MDPGLSLREDTGGGGGGTVLGQSACDIRGAPRCSPWSLVCVCSSITLTRQVTRAMHQVKAYQYNTI